MYDVHVLYDGYSVTKENTILNANCSCTLIKGPKNIIVDTMTPWDSQKIINGLQKYDLTPQDVDFVVCTHCHSDHVGNNNLFLNAKQIVGFSLSFQDSYYLHPFDKGLEYVIDDAVKVIPTPGHTLSDVTVIVKTNETTAITGDLFECFEDVNDPNIWIAAGSEDPERQQKNRSKVATFSDWIIPGHGPKFRVTQQIRDTLKTQLGETSSD